MIGNPRAVRKLTSLLLPAMLLASTAPAGQDPQPPPSPSVEEATILFRGREIRYLIQLDRIAVRTPEAMSESDFREAFEPEKMVETIDKETLGVEPVAGNVFTIELDPPGSRAELNRLASEKMREDTVGAQFGLVVLEEGLDTPMVLTNEIVVRLRPGNQISELDGLEEFGVRETIPDPLSENEFVLRLEGERDAIALSERLGSDERVDFAVPNFIRLFEVRHPLQQSQLPQNPYFDRQWHLANLGTEVFSTFDADVDASLAWRFFQDGESAVIAVIDKGFELDHPDVAYWENPAEVLSPGDDDGIFGDDLHGVNLSECGAGASCRSAQPPITADEHGTAAAGTAAALDNHIGVIGSCPKCRVMAIQVALLGDQRDQSGIDERQIQQAFKYATAKGAHVISNSWGARGRDFLLVDSAIEDASNSGVIVLFALSNSNRDNCSGPSRDLAAHPAVVKVAASDPEDLRILDTGFGDCLSLLAPGTAGSTTDLLGQEGYNESIVASCPFGELDEADGDDYLHYTRCFGGTSMATPITAGVAGMLAALDPELQGLQIRRVLQDTADKIEPANADYLSTTGFSAPRAGYASTHGWGRLNAFEAARIVAPRDRKFSYRRGDREEIVVDAAGPFEMSGRAGVDVFLRDHELDWGNTEQPSNRRLEIGRPPTPAWRSPDIKVDAPAHLASALTDSREFDRFRTEPIRPDMRNDVYVRVRNRGPATANGTQVKLFWATAGTAAPPLPDDLWRRFPEDPSDTATWHPIACGTSTATGDDSRTACRVDVHYSGSSVASTKEDRAAIARFAFTPPRPVEGRTSSFTFLAVVSHSDDPISMEAQSQRLLHSAAALDNNVAYSSVVVLPAANEFYLQESFLVRNPSSTAAFVELVPSVPVDRRWKVSLDGATLTWGEMFAAGEERLVTLRLRSLQPFGGGELTIAQRTTISNRATYDGITFRIQKP